MYIVYVYGVSDIRVPYWGPYYRGILLFSVDACIGRRVYLHIYTCFAGLWELSVHVCKA